MTETLAIYPAWKNYTALFDRAGIYEKELVRFLESEYGELPEPVFLAVVFVSMFVNAGHVCLPLNRKPSDWMRYLDVDMDDFNPTEKSRFNKIIKQEDLTNYEPMGTEADQSLFIVEGDRLFIRRYWLYERIVAKKLKELSSNRNFPEVTDEVRIRVQNLLQQNGEDVDYQNVAAALSLFKKFLLISGGPGTGKTTTIAKILTLNLEMSKKPLRIALAAPTGKAAARMSEAIQEQLEIISPDTDILRQIPRKAQTLHRLLIKTEQRGILPEPEPSTLDYNLIIVDEASMVDLSLMYRLLTNLGKQTRLIILGDKDQLSSVEAGAVLGDICKKEENGFRQQTIDWLQDLGIELNQESKEQSELDDSIVYLEKSYRFTADSGIGRLAECTRESNVNTFIEVLDDQQFDDVYQENFEYDKKGFQTIFDDLTERVQACKGEEAAKMLNVWSGSVWLTVLRSGPFGADALNRLVEEHLVRNRTVTPVKGWFHGRPVLVTRNDYTLGIYNGDLGVCELGKNRIPLVCFNNPDGSLRKIPASRIREFEPAYLLTVHKSQGSEFGIVSLVMPDRDNPLFTKELLYTAITRARNHFRILGDRHLMSAGVQRVTQRFTGLRDRL